MRLSQRIKQFRTYNKLSEEAVAKSCKIDLARYKEIEQGEVLPNIDELTKLAKIYKVTIKELYGSAPALVLRNFDEPDEKEKKEEELFRELTFSDLGIDEKQIILNYRLSKNRANLYKLIEDYQKENPDE